tara:strand:- start:73 stop:243 length:171 start_codon:yes stop_codon:yes gene_type:complete
MGRTKKSDGYDDIKMISIDNRKLYRLRIKLNVDGRGLNEPTQYNGDLILSSTFDSF